MLLSLYALTLASAATPFVSSLEEVSGRAVSDSWERWTFDVTNTESAARNLRICPSDVVMTLDDPANSQNAAFAVALGQNNWSHNCVETVVEAGESTSLKVYIRRFGMAGVSRTVTVETADGGYIAPLS